ncbi:MAG TPA: hypothetical protein VFT51_03805 [Bacillales bacterium]|nr:hypothetical protein [Bacillales bacterium]
MGEQIKELIALLRQDERNLTELGRDRIRALKDQIRQLKSGG